jgi:hypothetical protein
MDTQPHWQRLAHDGEIISAIKAYRASAGCGLAEAKGAVEQWREANPSPPLFDEIYFRICQRVIDRLTQYEQDAGVDLDYLVHVLSPHERVATTFEHIVAMKARVGNRWVDLAVEVATSDCTRTMFKTAIRNHLSEGARMVWLIDAEDVSVRVATPNQPRFIYHDDAVFDGGSLLSGFSCKVADLFG